MKRVILIGIIALMASGCMSTTIKPEAFGKHKRYAVISIIGPTEITDIKGHNGSGSLLGAISAAVSDDINISENSDKIFKKTQKILDQELAKAKGFRYVPTKTILKSKAYKRAKGSEPKFGIFTIGVAPGFKYFGEESVADIKKIIKQNRLDGAIVVTASYHYGSGGLNIGGLVSLGSTRGFTRMSIAAMDKKLNQVWSQHLEVKSKESISNVSGVPRFSKLYPLLEQVARQAAKEAVATLDGKVLAKK